MAITDENPPIDSNPLLGIEIEGVGFVRSQWDNTDIIRAPAFHGIYKRKALVRSPSYSDLRGVAITPEDSEQFGIHSPAELVSKPHVIDPENLLYLRNSVWKALSPAGMKTGQVSLQYKGATRTATNRWAKHRPKEIGGSLQCTIGVNVHHLLSDDETTRNRCIEALVGDSNKQKIVKGFATTAVAAYRALTAQGGALWHQRTQSAKQVEGAKLALFMAFINFVITETNCLGAGGSGWAKDVLGANFKGFTSFTACGLASNDVLTRGAALTGYTDADLIADLRAARGGTKLILALDELDSAQNWLLNNIGIAGLSIQVSVERWNGISNFYYNDHLYTVVECREKSSKVNQKMCAFLNAEKNVVDTSQQKALSQARTFIAAVKTDLGH